MTAAAEPTMMTAIGRGWTDRLRALHWPRRRHLGQSVRFLRTLPFTVRAALTASEFLLIVGAFAAWQVWDWWATDIHLVTAREGAGATTFANGHQRDAAHGKAKVIRLCEHGSPLRGLVRFDLSALKGRRNIRDAVLQLTLTNARPQARTIRVYGILDTNGGERWDEARQSWHGLPDSFPGNSTACCWGRSMSVARWPAAAIRL